ncbi:MAG: hypothetical protein HY940_09595 [Gammaproteobacteria bacterium]|nr:hypothetical protein [Gammaproteobacteria bacterium]
MHHLSPGYARHRLSPYWIIATLTFPALSHAALNLSYGGWTVNNGIIAAPCPTGATCGSAILDDGFMNRKVVKGGINWFQYIITDFGVTGDPQSASGALGFAHELFVQTNQAKGDVYSRTVIKESKTYLTPDGHTLEDRWDLVSSWATSIGYGIETLSPKTTQGLSQIDWTVPSAPVELINSTVTVSGYDILLTRNHYVNTDYAVPVTVTQKVNLGGGNRQQFVWKGGELGSHNVNLATPLLPGGTNGGDVNFLFNNSLTWVGQTSTTPDSGTAQFGFTGFHASPDLGTPLLPAETTLTSLTSANPPTANWPTALASSWPTLSTLPMNIFAAEPVITAQSWVTPAPQTGTHPAITPATGSAGGTPPPVAFDAWTVSNGVVTLAANDCPLNTSCSTPFTGAGFLQREIRTADARYFQTIVTDKNASGNPAVVLGFTATKAVVGTSLDTTYSLAPGALTYSDENFVRAGSDGIASKQQMADNSSILYSRDLYGQPHPSYNPLTITAKLNNGWAQVGAADPVYRLSQQLYLTDPYGVYDNVSSPQFTMALAADGSRDMVFLSPVSRAGAVYTHYIDGSFVPTGHTPDVQSPILPGGSNGGDISWSPGDALKGTWVSQASSGYFRAFIGSTSFANLSTGEYTAFTRPDWHSPAPWISPFGPVTLPTP